MNFFLPCLKLKEKLRGKSAWKKRHEPARTAYHRLMDTDGVNCTDTTRAWTRLFVLKEELERVLKPILASEMDERHRPQGKPPPGRNDSQSRVSNDNETSEPCISACSASSVPVIPAATDRNLGVAVVREDGRRARISPYLDVTTVSKAASGDWAITRADIGLHTHLKTMASTLKAEDDMFPRAGSM